jgi:hypothetical protein
MPRKKREAGGQQLSPYGRHVGRTPWSAADAHVGLFAWRPSRTRGSGADGGVRPTRKWNFFPSNSEYLTSAHVKRSD